MDLLTPLSPVPGWLARALRIGWDGSRLQTRGLSVRLREPPERVELDLRHFTTHAAVLHALAQAGHPKPWALGSCWSTLTDEQAGRATAVILRAVGEDPSAPVGVVPLGVLGLWKPVRWADEDPPSCASRAMLCGEYGAYGSPSAWANICFEWPDQTDPETGADMTRTGKYPHQKAGRDRAGADLDARAAGALFWEELTPA